MVTKFSNLMILFVCCFLLQLSLPAAVLAGSSDCHGCAEVKVALQRMHDQGQLNQTVNYLSVDELSAVMAFINAEGVLDAEGGDSFPAMIIGENIYYGEKNILNALPTLSQKVSPVPDKALSILKPFLSPLFAVETSVSAESSDLSQTEVSQRTEFSTSWQNARILAFFSPDCLSCSRLNTMLKSLENDKEPGWIARINVLEEEGIKLWNRAMDEAKVTDELRWKAPMLISGSSWLGENEMQFDALSELVNSAPEQPFWNQWSDADLAVSDSFPTLGAVTTAGIFGAGLLDGINPCAFTVMIFLVSLLMSRGRKLQKKAALFYGGLYILGVFTCYSMLGFVLGKLLNATNFSEWRGIGSAVTGIFCALIAIGMAADAIRSKNKKDSGLEWGLSKSLHGKIHGMMRSGLGKPLLGIGLFAVGFGVSCLELACTGQTYIPFLIFLNSIKASAGSVCLLLLYNFAFILPLIVILMGCVSGLKILDLAGWTRKNAPLLRWGQICLLVALSSFFTWQYMRNSTSDIGNNDSPQPIISSVDE